ncbi:MAG: hypothetical protein ACPG06_02970 [Alphaproteobacteria bacterium]
MAVNDNPLTPASVSYIRGTGEALVYGGAFMAVLFGLVALRSGVPLLGLLSGAGAVVALYHRPMVGRGPALAFDAKALFVQGVGAIPWTEIQRVARADKPVRSLQNPILSIELKPGWNDAPLAYAPTTLGRFLRPAGRVKGRHLTVPLEGLNANADDLTAALEGFCTPPSPY